MNTLRKRTRPLQPVSRRERPGQPVENRRRLDSNVTKIVPLSGQPDEMDRKAAGSPLKASHQGYGKPTSNADGEGGYCKPPKKHQFKPGQSGNLKGRPKKSRNLSTMLLKEAARHVQVTENGRTRKASVNEVVLRNIANRALQGDPRATKLWLEMIAKFAPEETEVLARETLSPSETALLEQMFALGGANIAVDKVERDNAESGDSEGGASEVDETPSNTAPSQKK